MANYTGFIKHFMNVDVGTIWRDVFGRKDPDLFMPNGSQMYHGYQGEGKTYSMFFHALKLKERYPNALLVSNLTLRDYEPIRVKTVEELDGLLGFSQLPKDIGEWESVDHLLGTMDRQKQYLFFQSHAELIRLLRSARNGKYGVIFMIDEIHNYFHSHDSKAMPMWVVQVFSQQRKQRLVILGTLQMWPDLIKAIRDQIDNLIACSRFGHLISQHAVDPREFENNYGEIEAPIKKSGWCWVSRKVGDGYDTYQVIDSGREIMGGEDLRVNVKTDETSKKARKWYKK